MKDMFLRLTMYSALIGTGFGILALLLGAMLSAPADSQVNWPVKENDRMIQPASDDGPETPEPVEIIEMQPMVFNVETPSES
jgi:hypothetical protein